jgi:hypothetical protein
VIRRNYLHPEIYKPLAVFVDGVYVLLPGLEHGGYLLSVALVTILFRFNKNYLVWTSQLVALHACVAPFADDVAYLETDDSLLHMLV